MKQEDYDVDYFLNFFGAIPGNKWCVLTREDGYGRHCAYGHVVESRDAKQFDALHVIGRGMAIAHVNNGADQRYQQPTPKLRVMAYLHDIKRQQEQAEKNLQKVSGDTRIEDRSPTLYTVRTEAVPSGPSAINPVTSALAMQMPCNPHNYVMGVCLYCCATKPVEKVEVEV